MHTQFITALICTAQGISRERTKGSNHRRNSNQISIILCECILCNQVQHQQLSFYEQYSVSSLSSQSLDLLLPFFASILQQWMSLSLRRHAVLSSPPLSSPPRSPLGGHGRKKGTRPPPESTPSKLYIPLFFPYKTPHFLCTLGAPKEHHLVLRLRTPHPPVPLVSNLMSITPTQYSKYPVLHRHRMHHTPGTIGS